MKKKISLCASCMIIFMLTAFAFTLISCSGKDEELSVEEMLSHETTPITFEFQDFDRNNEYILFDYAGNRYVGSDTIKDRTATINLRQGKHHLIWMKGQYGDEIGFIPESKSFDMGDKPFLWRDRDYVNVSYLEMDIDVTPYLIPAKRIECKDKVVIQSCGLRIDVTDIEDYDGLSIKVIDFPSVKSISMSGDRYELENRYESIYFYSTPTLFTACPNRGFENTQIRIELWEKGILLSTSTPPQFNLIGGYTTVLRGPLFSGSTSDWEVEMEPYGK